MAQNINEWMMNALRKDAEDINRMPLQWLEIMRNSWTPIVARAVSFIINGGTFLLCVDSKRIWLKHYILNHLNNSEINRPFIPVYGLDSSLINLLEAKQSESVKDILDISYNSYALWYIGKSNSVFAEFALDLRDSFLWVLDDSLEHSFTLNSNDPNLDFKLLQAYRIFEQTLFSGICGEFNIESY